MSGLFTHICLVYSCIKLLHRFRASSLWFFGRMRISMSWATAIWLQKQKVSIQLRCSKRSRACSAISSIWNPFFFHLAFYQFFAMTVLVHALVFQGWVRDQRREKCGGLTDQSRVTADLNLSVRVDMTLPRIQVCWTYPSYNRPESRAARYKHGNGLCNVR